MQADKHMRQDSIGLRNIQGVRMIHIPIKREAPVVKSSTKTSIVRFMRGFLQCHSWTFIEALESFNTQIISARNVLLLPSRMWGKNVQKQIHDPHFFFWETPSFVTANLQISHTLFPSKNSNGRLKHVLLFSDCLLSCRDCAKINKSFWCWLIWCLKASYSSSAEGRSTSVVWVWRWLKPTPNALAFVTCLWQSLLKTPLPCTSSQKHNSCAAEIPFIVAKTPDRSTLPVFCFLLWWLKPVANGIFGKMAQTRARWAVEFPSWSPASTTSRAIGLLRPRNCFCFFLGGSHSDSIVGSYSCSSENNKALTTISSQQWFIVVHLVYKGTH